MILDRFAPAELARTYGETRRPCGDSRIATSLQRTAEGVAKTQTAPCYRDFTRQTRCIAVTPQLNGRPIGPPPCSTRPKHVGRRYKPTSATSPRPHRRHAGRVDKLNVVAPQRPACAPRRPAPRRDRQATRPAPSERQSSRQRTAGSIGETNRRRASVARRRQRVAALHLPDRRHFHAALIYDDPRLHRAHPPRRRHRALARAAPRPAPSAGLRRGRPAA